MTAMRKLLKKLPLLIVTAMPGLQRLLIVVATQQFLGLEKLGKFVNDSAVVFLLATVTSIGWAGLLMVRLPAEEATGRVQQVLKDLLIWVFISTAVGLAVIPLLWSFGLVFNVMWSCLLLIGWTGYQIFRSYYIALKMHYNLMWIEIVLIALMICIVLFLKGSHHNAPYIASSVPLILLVLASSKSLFYVMGASGWTRGQRTASKGLEIAFSNFVGGGITQMLPPVAVHIAGLKYAGLLGIISNFIAIIILIPRSMVFEALPATSRLVKQNKYSEISAFLKSFRLKLIYIFAGVGIASFVFWYAATNFFYREELALPGSSMIFILLLLNLIINQLSLPDANYFMAKEETRFVLKLNTVTFVSFLILLESVNRLAIASIETFYYILFGVIIISSLRTAYFFRQTDRSIRCCLDEVIQRHPA